MINCFLVATKQQFLTNLENKTDFIYYYKKMCIYLPKFLKKIRKCWLSQDYIMLKSLKETVYPFEMYFLSY